MRRITRMIATVTLAATASAALAQDKGWLTDSTVGEDLYDISFPGGTAAEYFNELGAESEGDMNVIVQSGVDLVELPPINVKRVSGNTLIALPAKLAPYLIVDDSDGLGGASEDGDEPRGAATIVVTVNSTYMQSALAADNNDWGKRRFDLRFDGGTAIDYVNAIREAYPTANILAMTGVEGFSVPAVNLEGVTVKAALEAIADQRATIDGGVAEMQLERAEIKGTNESVFTLSLKRHDSEADSMVWSVGEQFELGVDEADLLSAVRAVLELNDQQAVVRFHPETKLLMVRGSQQTLEMVNQTLEQIQQSAWVDRKRDNASNESEAISRLRARITELERQLGERGKD